jgi:hypothetical protein
MENFFELFLKGVVSIIILYIAFNATFRYHSVVRLPLLAVVVLGATISYLFIGTVFYIAYLIAMAIIIILGVAAEFMLHRKKMAAYLLISVLDKEKSIDQTIIEDCLKNVGGNTENIKYLVRGENVILIRNEDRKTNRKFQKQLEEYFQKNTIRFGLVQYIHIVIALIMIVSIWRF